MARCKTQRTSLIELGLPQHYSEVDLLYDEELQNRISPQEREGIRIELYKELQRPAGGFCTMDFCTLGMFIIGGSTLIDRSIT